MEEIVSEVRAAFNSGKSKPLQFREAQLRSLKRLLEENEASILEALQSDLHKSSQETYMVEIDIVVAEIDYVLKQLKKWLQPQNVEKTWLLQAVDAFTQREPFGVVLVISPWNYPVQLALLPLVGAIAAGNCVVLKPSEISESVTRLLTELVPKYLDGDCFRVVNGGVAETTELLQQRFDFICYTGSSPVGRIVMRAAAEHLTPLLLELGGKSPLYIDHSVDLSVAAKRIIWGKFINAGQTCVAPDYVLCHEDILQPLLEAFKTCIDGFYGSNPGESNDFGRIITERQFERLDKYLADHSIEVLLGGQRDHASKYISPTIVKARPESLCMQDEIFGPILPIVLVKDQTEAIKYINSQEKPLALYVFSQRREVTEMFLNETSSGGVCINDTLMHLTLNTLPFGGVGNSGMGSYHGKHSFEAFSHHKSVMRVPMTPFVEGGYAKFRYPPYNNTTLKWARYLLAGKGSSWCNVL